MLSKEEKAALDVDAGVFGSNSAAAALKTCRWTEALAGAQLALKVEPDNEKAAFRKSKVGSCWAGFLEVLSNVSLQLIV